MPKKEFICKKCGICCIVAPCLIELADLPELAKHLNDPAYNLILEDDKLSAQIISLKPSACAFFRPGLSGMECTIFDKTEDNFEAGCELPRVEKLILGKK